MSKKTILYVDDEQWYMQGAIQYLAVTYDVETARNADQAMEILETGEKKIDLIVLDIMMPPGQRIPDANHGRTSGLAFVRAIQAHGLHDMPIICYTVVNDPVVHSEV